MVFSIDITLHWSIIQHTTANLMLAVLLALSSKPGDVYASTVDEAAGSHSLPIGPNL
jgi:hypothetical protein